jgi:hypothetical protein
MEIDTSLKALEESMLVPIGFSAVQDVAGGFPRMTHSNRK